MAFQHTGKEKAQGTRGAALLAQSETSYFLNVRFWRLFQGWSGQALLAFILVISQLHVCEPNFVRLSGEDCGVCETLTWHPSGASMSDSHGDCHDCCELQECSTPPTLVSALSVIGVHFELGILPEPPVLPEFAEATEGFRRTCFIESAPPLGPPTRCTSRGPPAHLQFSRLLDAGHDAA